MMAAIPSTQLTAQVVQGPNAAAASAATADAGTMAGFPFLFADLLTQQLGMSADGKVGIDLQGDDIKDILSGDKTSDRVLDAGLIENLSPTQQPLATPFVAPVNADPVVAEGEEASLPSVSAVAANAGRQSSDTVNLAEKIMAARQPVAGEQEIIAETGTPESFSLPSGILAEQPVRPPQHGLTPVASASSPVAGAIQQPVSSPGWGDVLGDRVMWMVGQQQQGAELRLNPPALGPLEIKLSMADGQATLTFSTQHLPVKEALEAATPRLKEIFSESGINLGSVSVNVGTSSQQQQAEAQHTPRQGADWNEAVQAESEFSSMAPVGITELKRQGNGMVDYFA